MTRRMQFLMSRHKCPACGSPRRESSAGSSVARFECGAVFALDNGVIAVRTVCPARCERAARLWNDQTRERAL